MLEEIPQQPTFRSKMSILSNSPQAIQKKGNWIFVAIQYLIQGILLSFPNTIVLTYSAVPSYIILSVFEATKIPHTIKFLYGYFFSYQAPLLETYTNVFYGKRKLWIVVSGVFMGLSVLAASFYTTENDQITMAVFIFIGTLFDTTGDISVDGLALKQIVIPQKISFIQALSKKVGNIIGGFIFLKLVSNKFGRFLGLSHSIMTVPTFFRIIAAIFIVTQILTHFFYKQQILEEQVLSKDVGLCQTIKQYKVFFDCKTKYFRTGMLLMSSVFSLQYFYASYPFQLMKQGFSKQRINQIQTISMFPIFLMSYYYTKVVNKDNMYKVSTYLIATRLIVHISTFIIRPQGTVGVIIYLFLQQTMHSLQGLIDTTIINYFPVTAVSGMMITMLNSMCNLGRNPTIHLMIVNTIGFKAASIFGFVIHTLFMIFAYSKLINWVKNGQSDQKLPYIYNDSKQSNKQNDNQCSIENDESVNDNFEDDTNKCTNIARTTSQKQIVQQKSSINQSDLSIIKSLPQQIVLSDKVQETKLEMEQQHLNKQKQKQNQYQLLESQNQKKQNEGHQGSI